MSEKFKTEQERFWASEFGEEYITRNESQKLLASNVFLFSKMLNASAGIDSVLEFGANIGMNLRALQILYPELDISAIEINDKASKMLQESIPSATVYQDSILNFAVKRTFDLALIKGVLIHINPDELPNVYDKLYSCSSRYILVAEYYNPVPVAMEYRGNSDRLFKRDFAGEMLERFGDLNLVDYGFAYHRDVKFPQDDISWFLLEKKI